jgi:hypothetical protein
LAATRAGVARGTLLSPAEAVAMLRDHGTGPWGAPAAPVEPAPPRPPEDVRADWSGVTVCMHVRGYQCTTASMVADLPSSDDAPPRVWASLGTPCTAVFLPVGVFGGPSCSGDACADLAGGPLAVVPDVLGDAEAWRSFAALGRRVEAPGDQGSAALATTRAVLAPVEAAAWDEADALWAAGAPPEAWRARATGWDRAVRAALASLV